MPSVAETPPNPRRLHLHARTEIKTKLRRVNLLEQKLWAAVKIINNLRIV